MRRAALSARDGVGAGIDPEATAISRKAVTLLAKRIPATS
jgi:hypothetical protein